MTGRITCPSKLSKQKREVMKTAKELLNEANNRVGADFENGERVGVTDLFKYALKEHDKEIISLIDEKIERVLVLRQNVPLYNENLYYVGDKDGRIEVLKELRKIIVGEL